MRRLFLSVGMCFLAIAMQSQVHVQEREVNLKIVQTSDIHGNYYPCDFITRHPSKGSLARIDSFVRQQRLIYKDNLILLDNGDILQGQPTVYYYNYIDTIAPHLTSQMMNFMGYDAGNMGNHDVETGHAVYDRWIRQCQFPVLGANIINTTTGKPYLKPYQIFVRDGVKIAVLGMTTPGIPAWLPERLWSGLRFDDMEKTARKWVKIIQKKEHPDLLIGLFHAGQEGNLLGGKYRENPSYEIARDVPGFDIVLIGHDHVPSRRNVVNVAGDTVLLMDPANNGNLVSDITIRLKLRQGKVIEKKISGQLTKMSAYGISQPFMKRFAAQYDTIKRFVSAKIGTFTTEVSSRPSYFGPSALMTLIHDLQMEIGKAQISFTAPLAYDSKISQGDVTISDMFNLYKYENMLYTMLLSGREVKGALEMSYGMWANQMHSPEDHLLLFGGHFFDGAKDRARFLYNSFNFDSAAGIDYTVDVTKPVGQRVHILSMSDGTPFSLDKVYRVAVNSYRGNGGGELLTKGAGIPQKELKKRIVFSTDKDLRYYLIKYIKKRGVIIPKTTSNWRFIPEDWAKVAAKRDYEYMYGTAGK